MSDRSHVNGRLVRSIRLAAASAVLIGGGSALAVDHNFNGPVAVPTDYNTPGNWTPAGVPIVGETGFIFGGRVAALGSAAPNTSALSLGADAGNTGTGELRLNAGSLTVVNGIQLGHDSGTDRGLITLTGGALTAGQVVMGEAGTGDNRINLSGGSLTLQNESFIGANGNGSLAVSGTGAASVQRLNVANALGSTGLLSVSGGTLNMSGDSYVGLRGFGTMNVSGGTVTSNAKIALGQENDTDTGGPGGATRGPSRGIMNVTGGTTTLGVIVIGEQSRGDNQLNVSAGTVNVNGDIYDGANGVGAVTLSGTGIINISGQLHMGAGGNGVGSYTQSGGTFTNNNYFLVGQNGAGTFSLSGGNLNTQIFSVGQDPDGFGTGTQTGGAIRTTGTFVVGEVTPKNNTYAISAGSIDIGTTGLPANGFGLFIGSGKGKGTMTVSGTANVSVRNGITIGLGEGGTADGTLNISGGTFTTINSGEDGRARIGVFGGTTGRLNVTGGTVSFGGPILNGVAKDSTGVIGAVGGTGIVTVGGGSLTAQGLQNEAGSTYTQTAGTASIGTITGGGTTTVNGGTLTTQRLTQSSLTVGGTGTVKLAGSEGPLASLVSTLTTSGTSKLDLGKNGLIIDYTGATSPLQSVRQALLAGRIAATLSPVDARQGVAYGEASALTATATSGGAFLNTPVDSTAVVLRSRLKGDANFTGKVDFDDLVIVAQNYLQPGNFVWTSGDFTYDGVVNFDDLVPLAQNYLSDIGALTGSAQFQADWAVAQSIAPEPASLIAFTAAAGLLSRRRRMI